MADIHMLCPDCGGAIQHQCAAQASRKSGATSEIAHVSKVLDLEPSPTKNKVYNQGYNAQFLEFWTVYPLHRDKRKAEKAWRNAVARTGANADARAAIIAGAIRYRDDPNRVPEFTKYAEGWLNGDGWEDEPLPSRNGQGPVKEIRPYDHSSRPRAVDMTPEEFEATYGH